MTKRFLPIQHNQWEGPGTHIIQSAKRNDAKMDVLKVWEEPIPELTSYDGLMVLGGTPNVDEVD